MIEQIYTLHLNITCDGCGAERVSSGQGQSIQDLYSVGLPNRWVSLALIGKAVTLCPACAEVATITVGSRAIRVLQDAGQVPAA